MNTSEASRAGKQPPPAGLRTGGTQSINRAVAVLQAVAEMNDAGGSVAEIATRTGLDRTTTHRILKGLAETRLLVSAGEPLRFFLGPLTAELGRIAHQKMDLRKLCESALSRIAAKSGDTVFLMVKDGFDSVCVERKSGSYPIKTFVVDVGTRRPLGIGASGMAILCALPEEEANRSLEMNAAQIKRYPGMSAAKLRKIAESSRQSRKVSMEVIGVEGVHAIAVPLFSHEGSPIGAFAIAGVNARMTTSRQLTLFNILQREAQEITDHLAEKGWLL